jgi:L-ribulose-5-phosphate 3-epimerase
MKKAMNAWGFPQGMELEEMLRLCGDAGFEGIELAMSEDGLLALDTPRKTIESYLKSIESFGLEAPSVATGFGWRYPLSSPDKAIREKGMMCIEKTLEAASILGSGTVLVVPATVTEEVGYAQAYDRSQKAIVELSAKAEDVGVTIGVENVWNKFLLSPLEFRRYLEEIGKEHVKAYFDVGNILLLGYPQDWIEILGDYISCVHVKDFSTKIGNITGFTYLLQGEVNWPEVMKAFRKVGYDHYMVAELGSYRFSPEKMIYDTASSLAKILEM